MLYPSNDHNNYSSYNDHSSDDHHYDHWQHTCYIYNYDDYDIVLL